jgi:predicted PurR-regulated permease PerM
VVKFFDHIPKGGTSTFINLAAIIVIIAGLRAAAPIVTQLLLIAFLVIILSPIYYWMAKLRVPSWLALTLLVLVLTVGILGGAIFLAQSFIQLARHLPEYQNKMLEGVAIISARLTQFGIEISPALFNDMINGQNMTMAAGILLQATQGFLARGFIVVLITAFCLYELPRLPELRKSFWMTETVWEKMVYVTHDVRHYMGIKTIVSLVTGSCIYFGLSLLSVDSPLLLGLMAFLLNYIPAVGSVIAAIPGILLALIKFGPERALVVLVIYVVVNLVIGGIMEPKLFGKSFRISPVTILVSMLFWGFVLGPVGMMLSVPLTMGMRVVFISLRELSSATGQAEE